MREVDQIKENLRKLPEDYEKAAHDTAEAEAEYKKQEAVFITLEARTAIEKKATDPKAKASEVKEAVIVALEEPRLDLVKFEATWKAAEARQDILNKRIQLTRNLCDLACAEIYAGMHTGEADSVKPKGILR